MTAEISRCKVREGDACRHVCISVVCGGNSRCLLRAAVDLVRYQKEFRSKIPQIRLIILVSKGIIKGITHVLNHYVFTLNERINP